MAVQQPPQIKIEPLGQQHDRGAFCCGNTIIDKWCRESAQKEHDKYRTRVFVACPVDSKRVLGFYSLTIRSLAPRRLIDIGFGQRDIPAIYFAMLGVSEDVAKQGIGSALMFDAFQRSLEVAENAGAYCLWLTSVSDDKAKWYKGKQFDFIEAGKLEMYIPLATIRDALSV